MEMGEEKTEGRWYWVRGESGQGRGIVVVIAWMLSKRRNLVPYTRMYAASGWDSLVCHPHVLNLWFQDRATALALQILDELAKEVEERPRPVVFATFSGGAKACLYKLFQILQGAMEIGALSTVCPEKYATVRACVAGQIHDSSPVDFVSANGARFVTKEYQSSGIPKVVLSFASEVGAKILDALFLPHFELQRADYWFTLHQSASLGPILILCSTNDDLAPFHIINNFAETMESLGSQVTFVVWDTSVHVGHFRRFPKEYLSAVTQFLENAGRPQNTNSFQSLPDIASYREFMDNNRAGNTSLPHPAYPSQRSLSQDTEKGNSVHLFQGQSAINSDTDSQPELQQKNVATYDMDTVRVANLHSSRGPSFTSKL